MYAIRWEKKAFKQLLAIQHEHRKNITEATATLKNWPECAGVKRLAQHQYQYRLRVVRYRVLFDVAAEVKIISIEEVKKRDEHTY